MLWPSLGNLDLEARAPKFMFFIKELNRKMLASSTLAKLRKSGSGGQGFEIDVFTKELDRKMIASSALARFWKSVMIVKSSYRFT